MQFKKYVCLALISLSVNSAVANQGASSEEIESVEAELGEGKIDATMTENTIEMISAIEKKIATKEAQESTDSIHLVVMAEEKVADLKLLIVKDSYVAFVGASALIQALDLINAIDLQEQLLVSETNSQKKAGMELLIKQMREAKLPAAIAKVGTTHQLDDVTVLVQEFVSSPYCVK